MLWHLFQNDTGIINSCGIVCAHMFVCACACLILLSLKGKHLCCLVLSIILMAAFFLICQSCTLIMTRISHHYLIYFRVCVNCRCLTKSLQKLGEKIYLSLMHTKLNDAAAILHYCKWVKLYIPEGYLHV